MQQSRHNQEMNNRAPAQYVLCTEPFIKHGQLPHTVQDWQKHCRLPYCWGEVLHCGLELIGLGAEHDQVEALLILAKPFCSHDLWV
jgi:hypothetical protein